MSEGDIRVDGEKLYLMGVRALRKVGAPDEHARMAADVLIASDLRGIESHGFARFADFYVYQARDGQVNLNPQVRLLRDNVSSATIDDDGGLGFLGGTPAMRLAIEKAQTTGVGIVSVRNSTHYSKP